MQVPEQIESVQQHRVTSETPAEMHQNHPERLLNRTGVLTQLSELPLALLIYLYTGWRDICIAKRQVWCARSLVERSDRRVCVNRRLERGDFQISRADCEQLSTTPNTNKEGIRPRIIFLCQVWVFGRMFTRGAQLVNLILYTTRALYCLLQPPVWLRAARVSADLLEGVRGAMQGCWG